EVAESEHAAIGAARIVRKDGFQGRMSLRSGAPLFSGKSGDADHSDLAVRPWLLRDPFNQIVVVGIFVAIMPFRLGGAPRLRNHMNVAVGDEAPCVARLDGAEPERRMRRLRR